jgi:fumarylacetoacetate (FAA) hydrolase family protein
LGENVTDPIVPEKGVLLGRVQLPGEALPRLVTVRDGTVADITGTAAPTVRDVCEMDDPAAYVGNAGGRPVCSLDALLENSWASRRNDAAPALLSPIDLQAVKAAGVTFVVSLLERVIEEQARGDRSRSEALRGEILGLIGTDLSQLVPGSPTAMRVKETLIARGVWSQYLEVGIGPDPEIFTKCQPMAAVGYGADVGVLPISEWNNPEPEVAVVVNSRGAIVGATLGNDVNLRDVEGRSALLLGKAKDNNASASLGPFVRLFDGSFTLSEVKAADIALRVEGDDGFVLEDFALAGGAGRLRHWPASPVSGRVRALLRYHVRPGEGSRRGGERVYPQTRRHRFDFNSDARYAPEPSAACD